jgi:signal transduction histidine kinase
MKIITQITIRFAAVAAGLAAAIYMLPSFTQSSAADLIPSIILVTLVAMAVLLLSLMKTIMAPLKEVTDAIKLLAKTSFRQKLYNGRITKSTVTNANELSRSLLMLELMRRKVLEVKKSLADSMAQKARDMQRINAELVGNEEVLKKAYAQLEAQAEEFKRMNEQLASANQELSDAYAKLQQTDKMKEDFITIAAQELVSPLEPILESVDRAERGIVADKEAWSSIISGTRRLVGVANSILDVEKIESGNFAYDMKPVSVKRLLDDVVGASGMVNNDSDIKVNIDMDPGGDIMITGDRKRLLQAFAGIINNSIRFTKRGTITIQARAEHETGRITVNITDNGQSFPDDVLSVLFEKYATITRENERGTGLGLYITRTVIEAHGGTISANNAGANKGVIFEISMPMQAQRVQPQLTEAQ